MAKLMKVPDDFYNRIRLIKKNTGKPMTEIISNMMNSGRRIRKRRGSMGDIDLL